MRLLLSVLLAALGLQATPPALSARVRYSQRLETPDGLTKTVTFEERMVRTQDQVWQERVLRDRQALAHPGEDSHLHPKDLGVAARFLSRDASGALSLTFVHPMGLKIHAEARDYPEVGFDGSWTTAFHLLDPARLAAMKPLDWKAPKGASWFESRDQTQFLRVLWSSELELPLKIEAGSLDGHRLNLTEVTPGPLPSKLPWEALQGLPEKEYTDLLD
jgi:hypothetical protein